MNARFAPWSRSSGPRHGQVKTLLPDGVIDELLAGACTEEEITGPDGLLGQLTKRLPSARWRSS
jgi:hypothetical protein